MIELDSRRCFNFFLLQWTTDKLMSRGGGGGKISINTSKDQLIRSKKKNKEGLGVRKTIRTTVKPIHVECSV